MTVENNSAIAIDTLSDWLKNLEPVFQPMKTWQTWFCRKTKANRTLDTRFFLRFKQVTCNC